MRWRAIATAALCVLGLVAVGGSSAAATAAQGSPAPPTNVRVPALALDEQSITLVWEKPRDHAGIVDYHVYMNGQLAGSSSQNPTSPAQPFIDGFYADPSNALQVKAVNESF